MDIMQSRRAFLKTATVALGGAAVAGLAGCAPAAETPANDKAASVDEVQWDEETDVIVVGGGLAGLAAAVTVATEGNGAKCLLLEKGPLETGSVPIVGVAIRSARAAAGRPSRSNHL